MQLLKGKLESIRQHEDRLKQRSRDADRREAQISAQQVTTLSCERPRTHTHTHPLSRPRTHTLSRSRNADRRESKMSAQQVCTAGYALSLARMSACAHTYIHTRTLSPTRTFSRSLP